MVQQSVGQALPISWPSIAYQLYRFFCRFYHQAALMIWPKARRWHNLCSQSLTACMSALEKHAQTMHHNQQVTAHVTTDKGPAINTEDACQLAEAMWSKFGPAQLIPPASKIPTARFSQLVSQLGTLNMVSKLADKLQVNLQTSLPAACKVAMQNNRNKSTMLKVKSS